MIFSYETLKEFPIGGLFFNRYYKLPEDLGSKEENVENFDHELFINEF
jgi:hypothetical protein